MSNETNGLAQKVFASSKIEGVVTPDDAADQPDKFKSIYIGGSGDLAVSRDGGTTVVIYSAVPQGKDQNIGTPCRIMATGTTATNLVWQNW